MTGWAKSNPELPEGGWEHILAGLKTLVETGKPLFSRRDVIGGAGRPGLVDLGDRLDLHRDPERQAPTPIAERA